MSIRRALATAATAAAALAVAGCGGGGDESSATTAEAGTTAATSAPAAIEIAEFAYAPETVTVAAGTEVSWTNDDGAPHTATADDGSFDTGTLKRGDDGAVSLDDPGTYTYYCRFHAFMNGTIEVE